ncbi:Efflux pump DEP3 [Colletotrichum gloeosporioides]|uniref:Efflux pump DEP3 n=1 Tax=Colletotrichum gloeosporioides TaxID=474922 RepID=A0A8H4FRU4_COLGL|nr:Efflux pump DEP3 [Colletotrichum gloeosporioides]KAF3810844.1 Efflux pump DEP3 [Colletotrichum gloeosporioides]
MLSGSSDPTGSPLEKDTNAANPGTENVFSSPNNSRNTGGVLLTNASTRVIHGWKWGFAYAAMLSTTLLFALDNTIVANIQPAIINDFGHLELLTWIGTGFALGTMFILLWGKVYGVFNIKWVYILNILMFEAGCALCGAAPNIETLIIGRVIAGVGGSGMCSGTLIYVSILSHDQEKLAYLAGSTVGGAFAASSATWRWVYCFRHFPTVTNSTEGFYVNLPIGAVFAPAYFLLFPSVDPHPTKNSERPCVSPNQGL